MIVGGITNGARAEQAAQRLITGLITGSSGNMKSAYIPTSWTGSLSRRRRLFRRLLKVKPEDSDLIRSPEKDCTPIRGEEGGATQHRYTFTHKEEGRERYERPPCLHSFPVHCKYCLLEAVSRLSGGSDGRNGRPPLGLWRGPWKVWTRTVNSRGGSVDLSSWDTHGSHRLLTWDQAAQHGPPPPPRNGSGHHGYSA